MDKTKYRISNTSAYVLIFLACVADIFTFFPGVGDVVGWLFWIVMAIYFWYAGLGLVNWRPLVPEILSAFAELFPGIQSLPTIVIGMIAIIILSRMEDKLGVSILPTKTKPKITPPRIKRIPANQNGVRAPRNIPSVEEISLAE